MRELPLGNRNYAEMRDFLKKKGLWVTLNILKDYLTDISTYHIEKNSIRYSHFQKRLRFDKQDRKIFFRIKDFLLKKEIIILFEKKDLVTEKSIKMISLTQKGVRLVEILNYLYDNILKS